MGVFQSAMRCGVVVLLLPLQSALADLSGLPAPLPSPPLQSQHEPLASSSTVAPGAVHVEVPLRWSRGASGFAADGVRTEFGFEGEEFGGSLGIRFGLWERLELKLHLPFVSSSSQSLNAEVYRKSKAYGSAIDSLKGIVAGVMRAEGLCAGESSCRSLIEAGYAPLTELAVSLGSGEEAVIKTGVPVLSFLDALAIGEVLPTSAAQGWGDLSLGIKYEFIRFVPSRLVVAGKGGAPGAAALQAADASAVGLSMEVFARLPTGTVPKGRYLFQSLGSGTLDLGVALDFEVELERNTVLGAGYLVVAELDGGRRQPASRLDSRKVVAGKTLPFSRPGVEQQVAVDLTYGLEGLLQELRAASLIAGYQSRTFRRETMGSGSSQLRRGSSLQTVSLTSRIDQVVAIGAGTLWLELAYPLYGSGEDVFLSPWSMTLGVALTMGQAQ